MDVQNLLAKASENLSVRRAFGAAYEKDGMLIIPSSRSRWWLEEAAGAPARHATGAVTQPTDPAAHRKGAPHRTTRHRRTQGAWTPAGASAGWYCRRAPTS